MTEADFKKHLDAAEKSPKEIAAAEDRLFRRLAMKVIAAIAFAILLLGQGAAANPADDRTAVSKLDTKYQAAVKVNDAATMDQILADDFVLVLGDGSLQNKTDLLNEAKSGRVQYEHQDELEQTVRVWGDTAVITAKLWGKGTDRGKPFEWTLWFSDTYVRTPGGWRYVLGQASLPLPKTQSQ